LTLNWNREIKTIKMKNLRKTIVAVVATGLLSGGFFCQQAQAVSITGYINFAGAVRYDTNSLLTATRVTQWKNSTVLGAATTGDFAAFTFDGEHVTMAHTWIFNPSTVTPALWRVGGFTFDLTSSTIVSQTVNFLNITGTGTVTGNGFDPTPGEWSFTSTNSNGHTRSTFGFQSQTNAVPDGGATAALLGLALTGVEVLRRKFKAA
jgi:VPDSG-CTERM motif